MVFNGFDRSLYLVRPVKDVQWKEGSEKEALEQRLYRLLRELARASRLRKVYSAPFIAPRASISFLLIRASSSCS